MNDATNDPTQLELPIVPRERTVVQPRERIRLDEDADFPAHAQHDALCTLWEWQQPPPIDGFWDVTDRRTFMKNDRWWFACSRGPLVWRDPVSGRTWMHDEFLDFSLGWRGLLTPAAGIYPTPPYDSAVLLKRAQEQGVSLRTMYAAYTRPQRKRNRL